MKQKFDLVIFGGTGDLSMRKLLPAMYRASYQGDIPEGSQLLITTRKESEVISFRALVEESLEKFLSSEELSSERVEKFFSFTKPVLLDAVDTDLGWKEFTQSFEGREDATRIFYLAVMPSIFAATCENLSKHNLITPQSRIVVEKPIGYDFQSAESINETLAAFFQEEQIFRIDHYLGKETVQNLLSLRFSNFLFENIWDSKSIDHVQISISEQVGLEGRAGFYDETGAMRDMVQNHLLQLLCLVAMESPNKLAADDIRVEKVKVLRALRKLSFEEINKWTIRGQYDEGGVDGKPVSSYLTDLENSNGTTESDTETYVAIKTFIENWRWSGVPFYLRTGKRLKRRSAEIVIEFKSVSHDIYAPDGQQLKPNRLIIQLQPDERIQLLLMAKSLGEESSTLKPLKLNLNLSAESAKKSSDYQRLLLNVIEGDSTLFIHRDEVRAAWKWVDPILSNWQKCDSKPFPYASGSWGPEVANELFEDKAQYWVDIEEE